MREGGEREREKRYISCGFGRCILSFLSSSTYYTTLLLQIADHHYHYSHHQLPVLNHQLTATNLQPPIKDSIPPRKKNHIPLPKLNPPRCLLLPLQCHQPNTPLTIAPNGMAVTAIVASTMARYHSQATAPSIKWSVVSTMSLT
jgi:hypothetical protein